MGLVCNCCGSYQGMSKEASLNFLGVDQVSAALDDTLASACETYYSAGKLVYQVACAEPAASLIVCEYLLSGQLGIAEVICDNAVCVYAELAYLALGNVVVLLVDDADVSEAELAEVAGVCACVSCRVPYHHGAGLGGTDYVYHADVELLNEGIGYLLGENLTCKVADTDA